MRFRIYYTLPGGIEDSIVVEGDTIEEIQAKAHMAVETRNGTNPWSEELK